jgi:hypothetical protein
VGRKPQSKLMSRRTERPYQADGTDKLAQHSQVPCSVPEVNGPVAQQEFTSLLREICAPSTPATEGAAVREDRREGTEVSRGHSTGGHEPANEDTGWTHNPGRAELGRQYDHSWTQVGVETERWSRAASQRGRERVLLNPSGLPGTAGRGPACPVVWGPGGQSSRLPD